jgi:hypothetical protein
VILEVQMTRQRKADKTKTIQKLRAANYVYELLQYVKENIQPLLNGTPRKEIPKKLADLLIKNGYGKQIKEMREKHHINLGKIPHITEKSLYQLSPVNVLYLDPLKIGRNENDFLIIPAELFQFTFNPLYWAFYLSANNKLIDLRIDLTWDKKDISKAVDDLVALLQKKIEKHPGKGRRKDAATYEVEKIIENYLKEFYVKQSLPLSKALEEISRMLEKEYGITIDADSIKKRYLPAIKNKHGIKKITELRSKLQQ